MVHWKPLWFAPGALHVESLPPATKVQKALVAAKEAAGSAARPSHPSADSTYEPLGVDRHFVEIPPFFWTTPRLETSQFVYLLTFYLDVGLFTCHQYVSIVSSYTHRVCDERHPLVQQHVRRIMSWGTDLLNLQPRHSYMESEIATYILRSPKSISKRRFSTGIFFPMDLNGF